MKINIGTTKGNLVAFEIDKNWKEIKLNDLIPVVQQKLGKILILVQLKILKRQLIMLLKRKLN